MKLFILSVAQVMGPKTLLSSILRCCRRWYLLSRRAGYILLLKRYHKDKEMRCIATRNRFNVGPGFEEIL